MHRVLLVEDNLTDVELFRRYIRKDVEVTHAVTGPEALEFLQAEDSRFDLVVLDLNLPGLSGFEILESMRATTKTKTLPVVVMTTSKASDDVKRAYACGCNAYVAKPMRLEESRTLVETLQEFWLSRVELPPAG